MPSPLVGDTQAFYQVVKSGDAKEFWLSSTLFYLIAFVVIALIVLGIIVVANDDIDTVRIISGITMFGTALILLIGFYFTYRSDILIKINSTDFRAGSVGSSVASAALPSSIVSLDKFVGSS